MKNQEDKIETYTDTTGITYKVTSMYVYKDRDGNYRSFADDIKRHLDHEEKHLAFALDMIKTQERLVKLGVSTRENIAFWERQKASSEELIAKLKKDLMKA